MLKTVYHLPITQKITVQLQPDILIVSGVLGNFSLPRVFKIEYINNILIFYPSIINIGLIRVLYPNVNKVTKVFLTSMFLTFYTQFKNTILGKLVLYKVGVRFVGVGYKVKYFSLKHKILQMDLGLSHLSYIKIPSAIFLRLLTNTKLVIRCSDKQILWKFIRELKQKAWPNIYTGKGIIIHGERLRKKAIVK